MCKGKIPAIKDGAQFAATLWILKSALKDPSQRDTFFHDEIAQGVNSHIALEWWLNKQEKSVTNNQFLSAYLVQLSEWRSAHILGAHAYSQEDHNLGNLSGTLHIAGQNLELSHFTFHPQLIGLNRST